MTRSRELTTTQADGRLSRSSLRDGVYDAVFEMLMSDRFTPGQSLGIETVARELGVSPSPVREALAELEHTGLITRAALRGYTVAPPPSLEQMAELFAARTVIETAAVDGVFPVSDAVLASLRDAHAQHVAAARQVLDSAARDGDSWSWPNARAYYDADQAFHLILLENCGNRYLLSMAQSLSPHLHRLRQQVSTGHNDVEEATSEHSHILTAIENGDPTAARKAMQLHLDAVRERVLTDARTTSEAKAQKTPTKTGRGKRSRK